jgi:hypothetical protein
MSEITIEYFGSLCAAVGAINGVLLDTCDFGVQADTRPEDAEDYCCANMQFRPIEATPEVLAKYKITKKEYRLIARELKTKLSFGACGFCS